jgi:hypothetical protein
MKLLGFFSVDFDVRDQLLIMYICQILAKIGNTVGQCIRLQDSQ